MSKLVLVRDDKFQDHITPEMHPESPKRLAAIDDALKTSQLINQLKETQPRLASDDDLVRVHKESYLEQLIGASNEAQQSAKLVALDADTCMSANSLATAKLAAGAGLVAIDSIQKSAFTSSFIAVRPPGHHASAETAMGFCLFNNIAVAARYAQQTLGMKRILIIDWDVHHGNGTQALFYKDPSVLFISMHQYPFWPNTGWFTEDGADEGKGYTINIPLPRGTADKGYVAAWDAIVNPVALEFQPELILVSAGYDAHQSDPMGEMEISSMGFAVLSQRLAQLAQATNAKVACFLEGGYDTQALAESVLATMQVLNADDPLNLSLRIGSVSQEKLEPVSFDDNPYVVEERVADVKNHFKEYWKSLK